MASIEFDIDEIVYGLMSWEKQDLVDELYECGYTIHDQLRNG